jgi:hypothetical protein
MENVGIFTRTFGSKPNPMRSGSQHNPSAHPFIPRIMRIAEEKRGGDARHSYLEKLIKWAN